MATLRSPGARCSSEMQPAVSIPSPAKALRTRSKAGRWPRPFSAGACERAPDRGWLGGAGLYRRQEEGGPWIEEPLPPYFPYPPQINRIAFSDSLTGWAIGRDGLVLRYYGAEPGRVLVIPPGVEP